MPQTSPDSAAPYPSPRTSSPRPSSSRLTSRRELRRASPAARWLLLGVDVVLILIFAASGNRTHHTGLAALDVLATAAPFLLALGAGTAVFWRRARPSRLWPDGVLVLIIVVGPGMALRVLLGLGGAPVSFILVTTTVLGILLLGRRLVSGLLRPATRG